MKNRLKLYAFYFSLMCMLLIRPATALAAEISSSAGDEQVTETTEELPVEETEDAGEETTEALPEQIVIQAAETIDYTEHLARIEQGIALNNEFLQYVTGFALFFVIIVICYFGYKFLRLFF